jgi:hypothetical protein
MFPTGNIVLEKSKFNENVPDRELCRDCGSFKEKGSRPVTSRPKAKPIK